MISDRNLNFIKKGFVMSKSSKSCGYTGRMKTMNRVNETKEVYSSNQAKAHGFGNEAQAGHTKHKADYPQVAAEQRAQAQCGCKETSFTRFKA